MGTKKWDSKFVFSEAPTELVPTLDRLYLTEIAKNIEEKKLKDQLVFRNQSEAKSATSEANLKKVIQEHIWQVNK